MSILTRILFGTCLTIGGASATQAAPVTVQVLNYWTSGGEVAALHVLADNVQAAGAIWKNDPVAGFDAALAAANAAAAGGNPPTALQFNLGKQFQDLADQGLLNNLDDVAAAQHWSSILPAAFLKGISADGHIYAAPIDNHGEGWMFTSTAAFEKAKTPVPTTWDEFFPAMDKLKAAGITPIAWGGQDWQEFETFTAILLSKAGAKVYLAVFQDRDQAAMTSPAFIDAAATFLKLRNYVDQGSTNRNWNDATAMLIKGTGGVQFMGDWAKGEFQQAKMVPGKDYGCYLGLGQNDHYFMLSGDVFVMPKGPGADRKDAQKLLATVVMSPNTQIAFNAAKGGLPVRTDLHATALDACSAKGYAAMQTPANQVPGPEMLISSDLEGSLTDLVTRYWSSTTMTPTDFAKKFAALFQQAD